MVGLKRGKEKTGNDFQYRVNLFLKRLRIRYLIETWDRTVGHMQYTLIGHLHRFKLYDEERLAYRILQLEESTVLKIKNQRWVDKCMADVFVWGVTNGKSLAVSLDTIGKLSP